MNPHSSCHSLRPPSWQLRWTALGVVLAWLWLVDGVSFATASGLTRVPNTSLELPLTPPVFGYSLTFPFAPLTFGSPVAMASPPGETNRLFIVDRTGYIYVITNLAQPSRSTFLDISDVVYHTTEAGLLGLAFHPGYATNGYFYVFYSLYTTTLQATNHLHERVSRFKVSANDPNLAARASELVYITQSDPADNHNGGDLHFGPDGYLYISVGDGGVQYDGSHNSQRIDLNYFSAIMRIDVDKRLGNLIPNRHPANSTNYFIPADNPYIGRTNFNGAVVNPANVRTEFYAIGFRNPWRYSFDPVTGQLYCGDVGQDAYEEVDVVTKGGNYGWAYKEGFHAGFKSGSPVGMTLIDPIIEYSHGSATNQGRAVIGGVVYRGRNISQLYGAYIFGDNDSGNIWATRYDGNKASTPQLLVVKQGISAFGVDPSNGDVLIVNVSSGNLYRLVYSGAASGTPLPATLAATGAFTNLSSLSGQTALRAAPGIVPYEINVPFWSDNAVKHRWFSVPNTNAAIAFHPDTNWFFPNGAVWIKHFDLELTNGQPDSAIRLETRFIVKNSNGVYGVTYRWDGSRTNAALVPEVGMDESFVIHDGGAIRTQIWHYPSRSECLACHTPVGGFGLGFNTPQMNRDTDYGAGPEGQLAALAHAGYFIGDPVQPNLLRTLAAATNADTSLEWRVRSYLAANCSQCHQPGGTALGNWDSRWQNPLSASDIVNGALQNNFGDTNNRVIAPGLPGHSLMLSRISTRGVNQMPPLDSTVLDAQAISLLSQWITNALPASLDFPTWQAHFFSSTNAPEAGPAADPDHDGASNYLEWLTGTDPLNGKDYWRISSSTQGDSIQIIFPRAANRGYEVQWTVNLLDGASWQALDTLENRPWFSAANETSVVTDPIQDGAAKYYRVRVYEP